MSTLVVPGARLGYTVSGDGPSLVFIAGACGSGAIYGKLDTMYALYREQGLQPAMGKFLMTMITASERATLAAAAHGDRAQAAGDLGYWFERELRQYPLAEFDRDALQAEPPVEFIVGSESAELPP